MASASSVLNDVRQSLKSLSKHLRFAFLAILILALGIGATSTIFSVVYAVLLDPYPYKGADRIVHFFLYDKGEPTGDLELNGSQFQDLKTSPVLEDAIAVDGFTMSVTGRGLPEPIQVARLSGNAFSFFGVPSLQGREFTSTDNSSVAVLSYRYWITHYAGQRSIIGETIQIDHRDYTIIGVTPQRFRWARCDVYLPLSNFTSSDRIAAVFGRIKPDLGMKAAEQALDPVLRALARESPGRFPAKFKVHLETIGDSDIGRIRGVLHLLFLAVLSLLLLACTNVAILLLARGESRRAEIALRKSLGASHVRIVLQLLVESSVISAIGGIVGVLFTFGGVLFVRHYVPQDVFPGEASIQVNIYVLCFSVALSMSTGLVSGLLPALRISRTDLREAMDAASARLATSKIGGTTNVVLLSIQIVLTTILLITSVTAVRKLSAMLNSQLGYDPQHLASVNITIPEGSYPDWAKRTSYYDQIRERIASDPQVTSAAIAEVPLPPLIGGEVSFSIQGSAGSQAQQAVTQQVSHDYFSTLGIPLLRGRVWTRTESKNAARIAVINLVMARRYWPHSDPIGQTIRLDHQWASGNAWTTVAPANDGAVQIVGIVGDSPNNGLDQLIEPAIYVPYSLVTYDWFNLNIRTAGNPESALHSLKEAIKAINPDQAVGEIATATSFLDADTLARDRFIAYLFAVFACLALMFASMGLHSILTYIVIQRSSEFGVRIALGASRAHIVRIVTLPSILAIAGGILVGVGSHLTISKLGAYYLGGNPVTASDLLVAISVLLISTGLASIVPVWIAISVNPSKVLRSA